MRKHVVRLMSDLITLNFHNIIILMYLYWKRTNFLFFYYFDQHNSHHNSQNIYTTVNVHQVKEGQPRAIWRATSLANPKTAKEIPNCYGWNGSGGLKLYYLKTKKIKIKIGDTPEFTAMSQFVSFVSVLETVCEDASSVLEGCVTEWVTACMTCYRMWSTVSWLQSALCRLVDRPVTAVCLPTRLHPRRWRHSLPGWHVGSTWRPASLQRRQQAERAQRVCCVWALETQFINHAAQIEQTHRRYRYYIHLHLYSPHSGSNHTHIYNINLTVN